MFGLISSKFFRFINCSRDINHRGDVTRQLGWLSSLFLCLPISIGASSKVMAIPLPQIPPQIPRPSPVLPFKPLVPPLPSIENPPDTAPKQPELFDSEDTITVKQFIFRGNTVFSSKQLNKVIAPFVGHPIFPSDVFKIEEAIRNFYIERGYRNSGALIPPLQSFRDANSVIVVLIFEGTIEKIEIQGGNRLQHYVRSQLQRAVAPVYNRNKLIEALQLLQSDPLVKNISANVTSGSSQNRSILQVQLEAQEPLELNIAADNYRSPLVGTFERQIQLRDRNFFGVGDSLNLTYRNTLGSNGGEATYRIPVNSSNGTVELDYAVIDSNIIEPPFNRLNLSVASRSYQISLRQPLIRRASDRATQEFALGLIGSREESDARLQGVPFPLSPEADDRGRTRISALRFFQDYFRRSGRQVVSLRSEFSLGVGALNATINAQRPDSRFFVWRGQGFLYQQLNRQKLGVLLRTNLQFAARPLPQFEQFSYGGPTTVRGYRQDALLTDNGALISAELRYPILENGVNQLQLVAFNDFAFGYNLGTISNSSNVNGVGASPNSITIDGISVGLEYTLSNRLRASFTYGIPLIQLSGSSRRTLQEQGFNFLLEYRLFGN